MSPDEYKQYHRETWDELATLLRADNIAGFMSRYADYLEKSNIISPQRIVLHRAARRAAIKLTEGRESE